jgi:hypothetical protein
LHHSGLYVLVCAAEITGTKQNSHSRASLLHKLTIPPGMTRWIVLGAFKYVIASGAGEQTFRWISFLDLLTLERVAGGPHLPSTEKANSTLPGAPPKNA